jgi:hypothetical protein
MSTDYGSCSLLHWRGLSRVHDPLEVGRSRTYTCSLKRRRVWRRSVSTHSARRKTLFAFSVHSNLGDSVMSFPPTLNTLIPTLSAASPRTRTSRFMIRMDQRPMSIVCRTRMVGMTSGSKDNWLGIVNITTIVVLLLTNLLLSNAYPISDVFNPLSVQDPDHRYQRNMSIRRSVRIPISATIASSS